MIRNSNRTSIRIHDLNHGLEISEFGLITGWVELYIGLGSRMRHHLGVDNQSFVHDRGGCFKLVVDEVVFTRFSISLLMIKLL